MDETWFDTHDVIKKGWVDETNNCHLRVPSSRGQRIIILHAGSKDGWVNKSLFLAAKHIDESKVDYHDMSGDVFFQWFTETLLKNLPNKSIIVWDNVSYHSVQSEKISSTNSRKPEIVEFLYKHDLYFEENYTKKQLLDVLRTKEHEKKNTKLMTKHENTGMKFFVYPHTIANLTQSKWYGVF